MKILTRKPISVDLGLLILRFILGVAMITHGWPKLEKLLNADFSFGDPIGLGAEV